MAQQQMEKEETEVAGRLHDEVNRLASTCNDLAAQLATLRKRVRQLEADFYEDVEDKDEPED